MILGFSAIVSFLRFLAMDDLVAIYFLLAFGWLLRFFIKRIRCGVKNRDFLADGGPLCHFHCRLSLTDHDCAPTASDNLRICMPQLDGCWILHSRFLFVIKATLYPKPDFALKYKKYFYCLRGSQRLCILEQYHNFFRKMNHEKNLSTEQTQTQKSPRIPIQNENRRWPQNPLPPSQKRTQVPHCVKTDFPKTARLLSKRDYHLMRSRSKRLVGKCLCIDYKSAPFSRLGITASGKYGSSCERNRFKRLAREAFRTLRATLPPLDLHIVPRQLAKTAKVCDIAEELVQLLLDVK